MSIADNKKGNTAIVVFVLVMVVIAVGLIFIFMRNNDANMEDKDAAMMEDNKELMMEDEDDTMMENDGELKEISVSGKNFSFTPNLIRVKAGETIKINFTSDDGFHDWVLDEFDAATEKVNTGESTSIQFVASKAGTYEFYCSVGQHRQMGMVGQLIVE